MNTDCPFCDYAGPSKVLLERDGVFFIEPLNPVTPGHVLAIPRQHIEDALADPEVTGEVMEVAAWFATGDCNLITSVGAAATQTVRHLHIHIVPRREGDGLLLPWDVRIKEALSDLSVEGDDGAPCWCPRWWWSTPGHGPEHCWECLVIRDFLGASHPPIEEPRPQGESFEDLEALEHVTMGETA